MLHKFKVEKPEGAEEIGKCPVCGNSIIEGEKGFGCIGKMDAHILFGKMISSLSHQVKW